MYTAKRAIPLSVLLVVASLAALGQNAPRTTAQSVRGHFASVNQRILTMAKDFPEDKYDFKLKPEMRTFWRGDRAHRFGGCIRGEGRPWRER